MINEDVDKRNDIPITEQKDHIKEQNHIEEEQIVSEVENEAKLLVDTKKQKKFVSLPSGQDLMISDINRVLSRYPTKVLVIAGAPDSGKTTLISAIYSQFHFGPFADYLFAGSESLLGFERRCHLSRISSELIQPDTERTKNTDLKMLHLRLCDLNRKKLISEILLSDVSGELFRDFSGSSEIVENLKWITRADRFILLIDGDKLLSNEKKHEASSSATLILRTCLDNNLINNEIDIDIILSKYDLIKHSSKQKETLKFWNEIKKEIELRLSTCSNDVRFMEIGSRGLEDDAELKSKLSELFSLWVKDPGRKEENFSNLYKDINLTINNNSVSRS